MPRKTASQKRLEAVRHPKLLALRGIKIGPIWPDPEEIKDVLRGMRGVPMKKTKARFTDKYRELRNKRNKAAKRSRIRNAE